MPELPEVETIKNQLQDMLPFKIQAVFFSTLGLKNIIKSCDLDLKDGTYSIIKIERKAKWLLLTLDPTAFIILHLGMSGSLRKSKRPLSHEKHLHIQFTNDLGECISYVDPRRFGKFYLLNEENFKEKIKNLSIDITDLNFDKEHIATILFSKSHWPIKVLMLDQKYFPGIGNYMASEICAHAKILPHRYSGDLNAEEIAKLKSALDKVVSGAIQSKGTTFQGGYTDALGEKGQGVKNLIVFYQKTCQNCLTTKVIKTYLGGRGTYYCPLCQS